MCYHGPLPSGGQYFGIAATHGRTIWERQFPQASFYGHLTPDSRRPALIIDGSFSKDRLQCLYYDDDATPAAKPEPTCVHGTQWNSIPGQYSQPHPLADPTGKWIAFTATKAGRSDVYVVQL